jgi:hypothetical protein
MSITINIILYYIISIMLLNFPTSGLKSYYNVLYEHGMEFETVALDCTAGTYGWLLYTYRRLTNQNR